jgi:mRNA-degrading endonuclease RelE of RelBE toxin-antitoxin system
MKVKVTEPIQNKIGILPLEIRKKLALFLEMLEIVEGPKGLLELGSKNLREFTENNYIFREFTENNYIIDENQKIYVARIGNYRLFYAVEEISESEDALILLDIIKR